MLKEVKIELTNRCSRNCKHCSSCATNDINHLQELDFNDVVKIIKEAKMLGVETIVFTGGEPLMYEKLDDLIKLTTSLGMQSTIYSFAYRTEVTLTKYRQLIESGLNKIVYSLADSLSEEDLSTYDLEDFFDQVFENTKSRLGFHYAVSKDSIEELDSIIGSTIDSFDDKSYFDKIGLLRFVAHGKGTKEMNLSKDELLRVRNLYITSSKKTRIRLGSPWNILGINHTPCIIADEIMIIGFDGIAYPCDSIKYFTGLGVSGNIKDNTLSELYNSLYFKRIRSLNIYNGCMNCSNYQICRSGCIGQKILSDYNIDDDPEKVLKKCMYARDPNCMR